MYCSSRLDEIQFLFSTIKQLSPPWNYDIWSQIVLTFENLSCFCAKRFRKSQEKEFLWTIYASRWSGPKRWCCLSGSLLLQVLLLRPQKWWWWPVRIDDVLCSPFLKRKILRWSLQFYLCACNSFLRAIQGVSHKKMQSCITFKG